MYREPMSENTILQSEESVPPSGETTGPSIEFFAVGIAINLILIAAFFVWAFKQGKGKK